MPRYRRLPEAAVHRSLTCRTAGETERREAAAHYGSHALCAVAAAAAAAVGVSTLLPAVAECWTVGCNHPLAVEMSQASSCWWGARWLAPTLAALDGFPPVSCACVPPARRASKHRVAGAAAKNEERRWPGDSQRQQSAQTEDNRVERAKAAAARRRRCQIQPGTCAAPPAQQPAARVGGQLTGSSPVAGRPAGPS